MKRVIILIVCIFISIMGCCSCDNSKDIQVWNNSDSSKENYSYILDGNENVADEDLVDIKIRLNKIYKYLKEKRYNTKKVKIILGNHNEIKREDGKIIIPAYINDFDLMQVIMQYEFTEYVNYGLMYGVMYDMAKNGKLEFEDIESYELENIIGAWEVRNLSYINLTGEIVSEFQRNISKYISVRVVEFVEEKYGSDFLFELMMDSAEATKVHRVSEVLREYIIENIPDYDLKKNVSREIFNQRVTKDIIQYKSENIEWIINLNTYDSNWKLPNIHDNMDSFYFFTEVLYSEIERLEEVIGFKKDDLPPLKILFYVDDPVLEGINLRENQIGIKFIESFSRFYANYADVKINGKARHWAINAMRAAYYSRDFELTEMNNERYFERLKNSLNESERKCNLEYKYLLMLEEYFGREIGEEDYALHSDLKFRKEFENGNFPPLYGSKDIELREYYVSLMSFLVREYGEDALDTITLEDKLPDGSKKHLDSIIEEWKEYIIDLSEADYEGYYKD